MYFLIVSASGQSLGDLLSGFVSGSASGLSPGLGSGFQNQDSGSASGLGSGFQKQDRAFIAAAPLDQANGVAGNTFIKPKPSPFRLRPSYRPPRLTNSRPRPTNSPTRYTYNQPKRSYSQPRPSNSQPNRIGSYKSTRNTISKSSSIIDCIGNFNITVSRTERWQTRTCCPGETCGKCPQLLEKFFSNQITLDQLSTKECGKEQYCCPSSAQTEAPARSCIGERNECRAYSGQCCKRIYQGRRIVCPASC